MRRLLPCLALLALLAGGGSPRAAEEGRSVRLVVPRLEAENGAPIYRDSWALVIGINRYPQGGPVRRLHFAVADAQSVRDLLVNHYGFPAANVTLLLDEQASKQAILKALTDLADKTGENDRVIVYFSGHGHTVDLPREGKRGYLIPADAQLEDADLSRPARVEAQCVPMTEVRQKARLMQARHVLFLIDACYSGLAINGRTVRSVPYHLKTAAFRPMLGIIAAGSAGEEALENPELGHGAFTKKLLDGLTPVHGTMVADTEPVGEPDGVVTLKELAAYLCTAVPQVTQGKQNPVDAQENEGQMLFFPAGGVPARPPATLRIEEEKPQPTTATLRVQSDPAGAKVWVWGPQGPKTDSSGSSRLSVGLMEGMTPCEVTLDAEPGGTPYTVELQLDGYEPEKLSVIAQPGAKGETTAVRLKRLREIQMQTPTSRVIDLREAEPPPITSEFQTWTNPKDGMEFVFVPAGPFKMGDRYEEHTVNLPGYWIGKYEVTIGQFRKFMAATGYKPAGDIEQWGKNDRLPVVSVSWNDAIAYCKWAGVRLPTEAEWEKAARGTDGREFVWGNAWPPPKGAGNFADATTKRKNTDWTIIEGYDDGYTETAPVGSFLGGASPYGCLDMAGNVWEWCSSAYKPYPYHAEDGRENTSDSSHRVSRGGSFDSDLRVLLRAASRFRYPPDLWGYFPGFRCARSSE